MDVFVIANQYMCLYDDRVLCRTTAIYFRCLLKTNDCSLISNVSWLASVKFNSVTRRHITTLNADVMKLQAVLQLKIVLNVRY